MNFIEKCIAGINNPEDIDDFIASWHRGTSELPLAEEIGFTRKEYAEWCQNPKILNAVIERRKNNND